MRASFDEPEYGDPLDLAGAMPPLPDDVWARALDVAFDPSSVADPQLAPEQDDEPLIPADDELAGAEPGDAELAGEPAYDDEAVVGGDQPQLEADVEYGASDIGL